MSNKKSDKNANSSKSQFKTVAMAEILLVQDLVEEAQDVIKNLEKDYPNEQRVIDLRNRMTQRLSHGETKQLPVDEQNKDLIEQTFIVNSKANSLSITWELTNNGLSMAKKRVKYSGVSIIRLFTAVLGPRGVRKTNRDIEIEHNCAKMLLTGIPKTAVFVASVGFLGNNGHYVPMAISVPAIIQ